MVGSPAPSCAPDKTWSRIQAGGQSAGCQAWSVPGSPKPSSSAEDRVRPAPRKGTPRTHIFVVNGRDSVTELLQSNVSSVTRGAVHEFGMAGAVKFPGLVKSPGLVVGSVDPGQRRQHRGLVLLYRQLHEQPTGSLGSTSGIELMLLLCAAYVFGCAFRSFLPRADVQRICLFDTWLSSVVVGRSVATVAEICFAAQWAIILHQLGTMTGADTTLNAAWVIVPLILIAECFSWYAVLTTHYLGNAIENSIWAVAFFIIGIGLCRLLPEFDGPVRVVLAIAIIGIAALSGVSHDHRRPDVSEPMAGRGCRWQQASRDLSRVCVT